MGIRVEDNVAWRWGNGLAQGVVSQVHTQRVEITSKGKKIIRIGTIDNPALVIEHKSGNQVLKLASEVQVTDAPAIYS